MGCLVLCAATCDIAIMRFRPTRPQMPHTELDRDLTPLTPLSLKER